MFNTIHIFGYGETQIIGSELNLKVSSSTLTTLTPFVDHIKSLRPSDVLESDYHVIHVFNEAKVMYLSQSESQEEKRTFTIDFDQIDASILESLIQELYSANIG